MGYSVPAAIGAKITFPGRHGRQHGRRRRVHDDRPGARHRLPPRRRADRAGVQQQACSARSACIRSAPIPWRVSGTALTNPDFCKYIEAFGGHGEVVSDDRGILAGVPPRGRGGKPAVIELRMNPEQITTRATVADLRAGAERAPRRPSRNRRSVPVPPPSVRPAERAPRSNRRRSGKPPARTVT